jgi:hypothetical protein
MRTRIPGRAPLQHVTEANRFGSLSKFVGAGGEINATDRNDLLKAFAELSAGIASGAIFTDVSENKPLAAREIAAENRRKLSEAYHDKETAAWAELGSGLAAELQARMEREGFMRNLLTRAEVQQGSDPRIRVRTPNVRAVVSRGVGQNYPQFVRDKYILCDEFTISSNPRVLNLDLQRGSADLLEDKFYEAQEQINVAEDRIVYSMMNESVGLHNDQTFFTGAFTPALLQAARYSVSRWRLPVANFLFSGDILNDFVAGDSFSAFYDPISKLDIIQTGTIGSMFGTNFITDGFREPNLRVLADGEGFMLSSPEYTGAYTDRGPVESNPVDEYPDGVPARGWFMFEHISCCIANSKAVAKIKR